jgi:hypothetical protein
MFSRGLLTDLDRQVQYVIRTYSEPAPCPICGKLQTPWEASAAESPEAWATRNQPVEYACVECHAPLRHDVYFIGGWGWGNPALKVHA